MYLISDHFKNLDLLSIVTPIKVETLSKLLNEFGYDRTETEFLVNGFQNGFEIGFEGDRNVRRKSPNLKLEVSSLEVLWDKIMKEVKLKCFAGPFDEPPFPNCIQSPIGLVPKGDSSDTPLIFHLSYPRTGESVNSAMPRSKCTVKYKDITNAILMCDEEGVGCFTAKADMKSAFRNLPIKKTD